MTRQQDTALFLFGATTLAKRPVGSSADDALVS